MKSKITTDLTIDKQYFFLLPSIELVTDIGCASLFDAIASIELDWLAFHYSIYFKQMNDPFYILDKTDGR